MRAHRFRPFQQARLAAARRARAFFGRITTQPRWIAFTRKARPMRTTYGNARLTASGDPPGPMLCPGPPGRSQWSELWRGARIPLVFRHSAQRRRQLRRTVSRPLGESQHRSFEGFSSRSSALHRPAGSAVVGSDYSRSEATGK